MGTVWDFDHRHDDVSIETDGADPSRDGRRLTPPAGPAAGLSAIADALAQQIVRVEANFLRLPLFTLDNKHMRTMDGLRCEGTFRRAGKSYNFSYTVTRNTATYYPGPLARSAHFALLSIATERGLPIRNPLTFTWRELCARMEVQVSGKIVSALRDAITATKGLMIESRAAVFSAADDAPMTTDERRQIISLYDEVEFHGAARPDGSSADINAVWFSQWYLQNLNALYSGPLDYELWRSLNGKSLIASRLYEFLFLKFYGGRDFLRFNYCTLVKFIPVRTERYLSQAQKQLQPALSLLIEHGVLQDAQWVAGRNGDPQLLLRRGRVLAGVAGQTMPDEIDEEGFALKKVEPVLPEETIVREFHRLWGHGNFQPMKAEIETARAFRARFGDAELLKLLPAVVKRMQVKYPDAKTFVGATRYIEEIAREAEKRRLAEERARKDEEERERERLKASEQAQEHEVLKAAWTTLSEDEREEIRQLVLSRQPASLAKHPALLERLCLGELAKRFNA